MKRKLFVLAVFLGAAFIMMIMIWWDASHGHEQELFSGGASMAGGFAPDFELTDIRTGKSVRLSDFKGKAVLLNFWATWCPPCRAEIPWLIDLQKQYGSQGLQVLSVAMDDASAATIAKFARDTGINYPVLQGTNKLAEQYGGVDALPVAFFIDREARISKRVFGAASQHEVEDNVKSVLQRGQNATNSQPPAEGR